MAGPSDNEAAIPTNLRLLLVLEALAEAGVPVTPTELNQTIGLPKQTIHRLFVTLEQEGFVQRDIDGKGYSPGIRFRRMSGSAISSMRVGTARRAILKKLALEIGETCNIALPDRDAMVYLDRVETEWPLRIQLPIGTRVPLFSTASGKMYLASLSPRHLSSYAHATDLRASTDATIIDPNRLIEEIHSVRRQGFATDSGEFMDGMIAIAVPILDSQERLVSTLSFHAPEQRLPLVEALQHVSLLHDASAKLSDLFFS